MKKLTVGDNSETQRSGSECVVVRESVANIEIGEEVMIRFKDEFHVTKFKPYRLKTKSFRDEYDAKRGRYTARFEKVKEGEVPNEFTPKNN